MRVRPAAHRLHPAPGVYHIRVLAVRGAQVARQIRGRVHLRSGRQRVRVFRQPESRRLGQQLLQMNTIYANSVLQYYSFRLV